MTSGGSIKPGEAVQWFDDVYDEATKIVQLACDQCDARRHYVCTYHEGWADGFEAALAALVLAVFGKPK